MICGTEDVHHSRIFNTSCAETRMFQQKLINTMVLDDLVPCIARSSAATILTM